MRRRAFVPAAPGALEGRSLAAGVPHVSGLAIDLNAARIRADFQQFTFSGQLTRLRTQLAQLGPSVPYGKADGLGGQVNAALQQMQATIAGGGNALTAINAARQQVGADIGNIIKAHVADGTLVVTPY